MVLFSIFRVPYVVALGPEIFVVRPLDVERLKVDILQIYPLPPHRHRGGDVERSSQQIVSEAGPHFTHEGPLSAASVASACC